jgi:hypothetical protein
MFWNASGLLAVELEIMLAQLNMVNVEFLIRLNNQRLQQKRLSDKATLARLYMVGSTKCNGRPA